MNEQNRKAHRSQLLARATNFKVSLISFLLGLTLLASWLLIHPYLGIWHDAQLYAAQALHRLNPAAFQNDLFFMFGSQDDFSIFTLFYSRAITWFGLPRAHLLGVVLFQAVWVTGAWRLFRNLLPAPAHWVALLLLILLPRYYGNAHIFAAGEMFLSARLPAEAFCLWFLALAQEKHKVAASTLGILAVAIHPLMAGLILPIGFYLLWPDRRWVVAATTCFISVLLIQSLHNIGPFFDPLWRELVVNKSPFIFPSLWNMDEWGETCWILALPCLMVRYSENNKRLWLAVFWVGLAWMLLAWIADVAWRGAFWMQIQAWRILWILTVLQWVALIELIACHREKHQSIAMSFIIFFLFKDLGGGFLALLFALLSHVRWSYAYFTTPAIRPLGKHHRPFLLMVLAIALISWVSGAWLEITNLKSDVSGINGIWLLITQALFHTDLVVLWIPVLVWLIHHRSLMIQIFLGAALGGWLAYGIANWNQQGKTSLYLDSGQIPFNGIIQPGELVFWQAEVSFPSIPWLMIGTAQYFSRQQSAGIVFNRNTAIEAMRRSARVFGKDISAIPTGHTEKDRLALSAFTGLREPRFHEQLTSAQLKFLCSDPILRFVALPNQFQETQPISHLIEKKYGVERWLYDCNLQRQSSSNK